MSRRLAPLVVAAAVLLAAIVSITPWPVGSIQDDATYVILAKSLASGEGYRQLNLPGAPRVTHYPPGYPIFLAALWRLWPTFPDNIVLFKYANALLLTLAAVGAFALARARAGVTPAGAALAAAGGTGCVLVLYVTGVVLSEPLFLALLFASLLLAEKAVEDGRAPLAVAAGALGGALLLVRSIGIAFVPALVLALLLRRRWSAAVAALATALCVVAPWQLWAAAHAHEVPPVFTGKYGSYTVWLIDGYRSGGWPFALEVVQKNLAELRGVLDYLVMPLDIPWARNLTFAAALIVLLVGLTRMWRRARVTVLFALGYFAIVLLWPFEVIRFLMAGWPLLAIFFVVGVAALWQARPARLSAHLSRAALLAGAAAAIAGFVSYNVRGYRDQWWASVQRDSGTRLGRVVTWVERNTAPDDVLGVEDDPAVYLYTGRRTVPVTGNSATEHVRPAAPGSVIADVREILQRYQPRFYIVSWQNALRAADSLARLRPDVLRPVDRIASATVYVTQQK